MYQISHAPMFTMGQIFRMPTSKQLWQNFRSRRRWQWPDIMDRRMRRYGGRLVRITSIGAETMHVNECEFEMPMYCLELVSDPDPNRPYDSISDFRWCEEWLTFPPVVRIFPEGHSERNLVNRNW